MKGTKLAVARAAAASAPMPALLGHQGALVTPAGMNAGTTGRPNDRKMWLGERFQALPLLLVLKACV